MKHQTNDAIKRRYKMYKAGKNWLYAPLMFLSLGTGIYLGGQAAQAATTDQQDQATVTAPAPVVTTGSTNPTELTAPIASATLAVTAEAPAATPEAPVTTPEIDGRSLEQEEVDDDDLFLDPTTIGRGDMGQLTGVEPRAYNLERVDNKEKLESKINEEIPTIVLKKDVTIDAMGLTLRGKTVTIDGDNGQYGIKLEGQLQLLDGARVTFRNIKFISTGTNTANVKANGANITLMGKVELKNDGAMLAPNSGSDHFAFFYADADSQTDVKNHSTLILANGANVQMQSPKVPSWLGQNFAKINVSPTAKITANDLKLPDAPFNSGYKGILTFVQQGRDEKGAKHYVENGQFQTGVQVVNPNHNVYYFYPEGDPKSYEMALGKVNLPDRGGIQFDFGTDGRLWTGLNRLWWGGQSLTTYLQKPEAKARLMDLGDLDQELKAALTKTKEDMLGQKGQVLIDDYAQLQKTVPTLLKTVEANKIKVKATNKFRTSDEDKRKDFETTLQKVQELSQNVNTSPIEARDTIQALLEAEGQLNGMPVNKDALTKVVNEAPNVKKLHTYYNADDGQKRDYDEKVAKGAKALKEAGVDQQTVNDAFQAIVNAKGALDGKKTNKEELSQLILNQGEVIKNVKYTKANSDKQKLYDTAISEGLQVVAATGVTQNQVDKSVNKIKEALAGLDGVDQNQENDQDLKRAKHDAKVAIQNAEEKKKKEIEDNQSLTNDEKDRYEVRVSEQAEQADKDIDVANTTELVEHAKDEGLKRIAEIEIPESSETKEEAKKHLDEVKEEKEEEIAAAGLDDETKNDLKAQVEMIAADTKQKIDAAKDYAKVVEEKNKGIDAIKNVAIPKQDAAKELARVKDDARAEIQNAEQQKNREIDANDSLTGDERDSYRNQAFDLADKAEKAIGEAPTVEAVESITKETLENIAGITVPKAPEKVPEANDEPQKPSDDALAEKRVNLEALKKVVAEAPQVRQLHTYYNAPEDQQRAYDDKMKAGTELLTKEGVDQPMVDQAYQEIVNAKGALDGKTTDPTKLNKAVDEAVRARKTTNYQAAATLKKDALDAKLKQAVVVKHQLKDGKNPAKVTQTAVDKLAEELDTTRQDLDGDSKQLEAMKKASNQRVMEAQAKKAAEIAYSDLSEEQKKTKLDQAKEIVKSTADDIKKASTPTDVKKAMEAGIKAIQTIDTKVPTPAPADPLTPDAPKGAEDLQVLDNPKGDLPAPNSSETPQAPKANEEPLNDAPAPEAKKPETPTEPKEEATPEAPKTDEKGEDDAKGREMLPAPEAPAPAVPEAPAPVVPEAKEPTAQPEAPSRPQKPEVTPVPENPKGDLPTPMMPEIPRAQDDPQPNDRPSTPEDGKPASPADPQEPEADQPSVPNERPGEENPSSPATPKDPAGDGLVNPMKPGDEGPTNPSEKPGEESPKRPGSSMLDLEALQKVVSEATDVRKGPQYSNADDDLKKVYDAKVEAGQEILSTFKPDQTQTDIDKAVQDIEDAKKALNGETKAPQKEEALTPEVPGTPGEPSDQPLTSEAEKPMTMPAVPGTPEERPEAAMPSVPEAKGPEVPNTPAPTPEMEPREPEVNQPTVPVTPAPEGPTAPAPTDPQEPMAKPEAPQKDAPALAVPIQPESGTDEPVTPEAQQVDLTKLKKVVSEADKMRKLHTYFNAADDLRKDYDDKVKTGANLIKQANIDQTKVNDAYQAIVNAKGALDGQATAPTKLNAAVDTAIKAQKTTNYTAASKNKQATLDAKLKEGVVLKNKFNDGKNKEMVPQTTVDKMTAELEAALQDLNGDKKQLEGLKQVLKRKVQETQAKKADEIAKSKLPADRQKLKIKEAGEKAKTAQTAIDDAKTADDAHKAMIDGGKAIEGIDTQVKPVAKENGSADLQAKKATAKQAIDEAQAKKNAEIDAKQLKPEVAEEVKVTVKKAADEAKSKIAISRKAEEVAKEQTEGIKAIQAIVIPEKSADEAEVPMDVPAPAEPQGEVMPTEPTMPEAPKADAEGGEMPPAPQTPAPAEPTPPALKPEATEPVIPAPEVPQETPAPAEPKRPEIEKPAQPEIDAELARVKHDAKAAIQAAELQKHRLIQNDPRLTDDEKGAYEDLVSRDAEKAEREIQAAPTKEMVATAKKNGLARIKGFELRASVKENAKKAVTAAETARNHEIDAMDLDDQIKAELKKRVAVTGTEAKQKIDAAKTAKLVHEAKDDGIEVIYQIELQKRADAPTQPESPLAPEMPLTPEAPKTALPESPTPTEPMTPAPQPEAPMPIMPEAPKEMPVPADPQPEAPAPMAPQGEVTPEVPGAMMPETPKVMAPDVPQAEVPAAPTQPEQPAAPMPEAPQTEERKGADHKRAVALQDNPTVPMNRTAEATPRSTGHQMVTMASDHRMHKAGMVTETRMGMHRQTNNAMQELPQTGDERGKALGLLGMTTASLMMMLGIAKRANRKKN